MLHVTNGSSAGDLIARSGLAGDVLTWDDVTEHGRRVLEGKLDAVELRGIDRCLGGIVLGPEIDWRWDPIRWVPVLR